MDIGTIATILALIAAVWALLPRYFWQELRIKITWFTWIYLTIVASLIFITQFSELITRISTYYGHSFEDLYKYAAVSQLITKQELLTILLSLLFVPFLTRKKLSPTNFNEFVELCHELFYQGKYHELVLIIDRNLNQIEEITYRNYFFAKLKDKFKKYIFIQSGSGIFEKYSFDQSDTIKHANKNVIWEKINILRCRLFLLIKTCVYGNEIFYHKSVTPFAKQCEEFFNNEKFIEFIATRKSAIIQSYFQHKIFDVRSTNSLFYWAVLNNTSFLFTEFKYSNFEKGVTEYLFKNPKECERLALWRPIGEGVVDFLDTLSVQGYSNDPYNGVMGNFYNTEITDEKIRSPIYIGISFFKAMVMSALDHEIEWHMWLYYYEHFLKGIEKNLKPIYPSNSEFPTRYHYLTWEVVESLTDIIDEIAYRPDKVKFKSAQFKKVDLEHENGSIIKSAMKCLGKCMEIILTSSNFTEYDKKYYLDTVFSTYFRLAQNPELTMYAEQYLLFIKYGGGLYRELVMPEFILNYLRDPENKYKPNSYQLVNQVIKEYYTVA